jgi:protein-disulfide isomerase
MSGKQARRRRQQATAPPPVARKGERRRASPKVLAGAAVIGLAAVGAAVGIALAFGGSSSPSSGTVPTVGTLANALPGAADVQRQLAGIPQHGTILGSPKAPVTMIEYIDLQCSACRTFETETMPSIIQRYIRTGKVRVEARPIVAIGPDSERGVLGSLAAARQDRLFNFTQILYFNQGPENGGWLNDSMVERAAASIPGLDVSAIVQARDSAATRAQAKRFSDEATADKVSGTPTLYVGKTGGKLHEVFPGVVPDVTALSAELDRALG